MDLSHFIQDTDNTASYDASPTMECSELEEFQSLSHLADEFSVLDCSLFPFCVLRDSDLRSEIYGFSRGTSLYEDRSLVRGNYVAGYILRELRIQSRKNTQTYPELCFIFDLPPELVFEIFEHLQPIDLYNLIRTSKGFRSLLLGPQARAVWRETFSRHPDIPSCPPDLSLPEWASLLFGPSTCDHCGCNEAMPDFSFRIRKCNNCLSTTLEDSEVENLPYFEDEHASQNDVLLTLIKRTHRYDAMAYPSSGQMYATRHCAKEAKSRAAEMKQFLVAIDSNQPSAQEAYGIFKAETASAVDNIMEHVQACNAWCFNFYNLLDDEFTERVSRTVERFSKLLGRMGYNPKDVEGARNDIHWTIYECCVRKHDSKAFRSCLPRLEIALEDAKWRRLSEEREELISQRKKEVNIIYKDCQRRIDPACWQHLPDSSHCYELDIISQYIDSHEQSATLDLDTAAQIILPFFDQWLAYGKRGLLELMSKHHIPSLSEENALDLATSVFICPLHSPEDFDHSVLLGWEDAAVHLECKTRRHYRDPQPTRPFPEPLLLQYSTTGRKAVLYLLGLLGMEASSSALDVEALEARFTCASCPPDSRPGTMKGRFAMKFKESVSHVVSRPDHSTDSFLLLSKEATESVVFHESSPRLEGELSWSCKHCSLHFESYVSRDSVTQHIQTIHAIPEPVQRVDFVYQRQKDPRRRSPHLIGLDVRRTYRCKKCPSLRSLRLWQLRRLLEHLDDEHDVSEPVENVDWYEIDIW
ncbi:hypothetical protein M413DRAFT_441635 [Hebeloma cylindrosporum]|uniref:F-box domain-containing protein n=1 Tax=Hebeloma cylindrosporum TaxID=76867 RepID=A0A0C3CR22_HEBCY|nr:hypothetical protein M413DRAFT_441635 [Hebeloma cylindrosporum h7]